MDWQDILERLRRSTEPSLEVVGGSLPDEPASVALLAGSFDPLTVGHAALVERAREIADLVVLVYSARTLPKEEGAPPPLLTEEERLETLRAFCGNRQGTALGLSSHGLIAEQAAAGRPRFPGARLLLVMGSDKVRQLLDPMWYEDRDRVLDELFSGHTRALYAVRAGEEGAADEVLARPENARWADRFERVEIAPQTAAMSSRRVRELFRRGEDVSDLVPAEVRSLLARLR